MTPYVAHLATLTTPPDHPDLIPTGEVSVMTPIDPYEIMGKKPKAKRKAKQGAQAKKPRRIVYEVIGPKQSTKSADSDSATREEPARPPPMVDLDEPGVVTEPLPRAKRARIEAEVFEIPGPSSSMDI